MDKNRKVERESKRESKEGRGKRSKFYQRRTWCSIHDGTCRFLRSLSVVDFGRIVQL